MEKFAVDLDAVLDEFELNEDQAEVAAARLQKQIEQGRLEIASSDTTPGSSYANSPRTSSLAHLHEESGRTVSPLARPVAGIEPATSSLTATNHRLPADPAANHSSPAELVANHDPPPAPSANHRTAAAYLTANERRVPDVVAEVGPDTTSSSSSPSSSSGIGSPEHYPNLPLQTNGGRKLLISTDVEQYSAPAACLTNQTPNGDGPTSSRPAGAATVTRQSPASGTSEGADPAGQTEKAAAPPADALRTPVVAAESLRPELSSRAEEPVPEPAFREPASASVAQSPHPEVRPQEAAAPAPACNRAPDVTSDVTSRSMSDGEPPPDVLSRDPRAGPDRAAAGTAAESADGHSPSADGGGTGTLPSGDGRAPGTETPPVEPSLAAAAADPVVAGSARETSSLTPGPAETAVSSEPGPAPGNLSSLLAQVAAAPSPLAALPTAAAESDLALRPVGTETAVIEPETAAAEAQPKAEPELQQEKVLESGPEQEQEPVQEQELEQEPVRFQPADDVSDSELETYLEQLEDDSAAGSAPADESFGGARPKTSPAAGAAVESPPPPPPEPAAAGAALQPLKGGVMSRLQSQVSIECEVDSRSTRAAALAADSGRGSPPPPPQSSSVAGAPVRPSSLDLPSRSQSITEQPESQPAPDDPASETAAEETAGLDAEQPPPPPPPPSSSSSTGATVGDDIGDEDAAAAQESVSTTGGNIVTAPGAYEEARLAAGRAPAVPAAATAAAAAATNSRGQLVSLSDEDKNLGKVAPVWVPDEDAVACMECELKFTVIRRRHHCRACGRLLCSACCSERMCLDYMEFREGRVCTRCKRTIDRVQQESRVVSAGGAAASHHHMARPPNPNNPMEYCSTVPPTQQASHNAPPPTVMVPTGVLKRTENSGGRTPSREPKQVMFSDGIRPGGDLTESARPAGQLAAGSAADPEQLRRPPHRRTARLARGPDRSPAAILKDAKGCKALSWKPESGKLPPIYQSGSAGASVKQSTPEQTIVSMIRAERDLPWSFLINKNLMVVVKMFKLDCCVGRTCWIFTSHGLSTVGQEEVVVILESLPDEATLPKDIFFFYHHLFAEAAKGHFVTELGHTLFSAPFLGSKDHGGFLFLRPTFQCLHNVPTPPQPFLVAVLIQKWEAPWAKVFPLRLLLRLGAEFRYYPCPLVSVRHRKPVFFEVGHTIINLLADFRNFAYVLPTVHGMHIHMEEQETSVLIPRNRFNQVLKAINNSNDHVLALGASFSREADSHLVCMQNEDGQYQTQAINIQNRPRQVTGASFVVFNGALKSAAGVTAKSSIVEDGLMFQISSDTMQTLRANLRQMQDYKIECGPVGQPPDEVINIKWVEDDRSHNLGVRSVIDDKPLDGIPSIRVHSGTDYVGDSKLIRWTEVYLIKVTESVARSSSEPPDFSRLAEEVARGTCVALTAHLALLADSERTRIGLRATVDRDTVGYEAGSNGEPLPPSCMNLLDSELVPVLHRYAAEVPDSPSCLELLFHVIDR